MARLVAAVRKFASGEEGTSLVEYSLLVALLAAASISILYGLGQNIKSMYSPGQQCGRDRERRDHLGWVAVTVERPSLSRCTGRPDAASQPSQSSGSRWGKAQPWRCTRAAVVAGIGQRSGDYLLNLPHPRPQGPCQSCTGEASMAKLVAAKKFAAGEEGASLVEYSLLVALTRRGEHRRSLRPRSRSRVHLHRVQQLGELRKRRDHHRIMIGAEGDALMGAVYTAFTAGLLCIVAQLFAVPHRSFSISGMLLLRDPGDRIRLRAVDVLPVLWGGSLSAVQISIATPLTPTEAESDSPRNMDAHREARNVLEIPLIPASIVLLASLVAAVLDVWKFKVYNALTVPLLLTGLAYHTIASGLQGLQGSLVGMPVRVRRPDRRLCHGWDWGR